MRTIICLASLLAVSALSLGAAAAPAKRDLKPTPDVRLKQPDLRIRCLSEAQIRAALAREGYRTARTAPKKTREGLVFFANHRGKPVQVTVNACTGKILSVGPARIKIKICMSKTALANYLKSHGYPYAKPESFNGPYAQGGTKVYRGQVLEKQGPRWCQVKLIVDCYTGNVLKRETLLDTCIY